MRFSSTIGLVMAAFLCCCSSPSQKGETLGELSFDVTGTSEARDLFIQALLRLHSFEFEDAQELFEKARDADPECAMAFWGEAMSYNHALWRQQDYEAAKSVLARLGESPTERLAKAKTELEKDFIASIDMLYGEGTKVERDKAYAKFMEELYNKYPKSQEVKAWYALALLGSVPYGRDDEIFQKSAAISKEVLDENPNHPGALHYFIHANDDPYHAAAALVAADAYSVVASDAAHALHMPTHIYVALGLWDKVISSNEDSWRASVERMKRKDLSNDALGYHSFHWLEYGYLQKDRMDDARATLEKMMQYCSELSSRRAREHEIFLKSTYLIESQDWTSPYAQHRTKANDLNIFTRGLQSFVIGMKAYEDGNLDTLESIIASMRQDRIRESVQLSDDGIALCRSGGASTENTTKKDIDEVYVMEMELEGLSAWRKGDLIKAEEWLKEATAKEASVSYSYGPPSIVKPSFELYGEFLLSVDRPGEAIEVFDISLQRAPGRVLSLKGKANAASVLKAEG